MAGNTYHVFELLITGAAVAASAGFVLRGWVRALVTRSRRGSAGSASPGGCSSCNSCGDCAPAEPPKEAPVVIIRRPARR